MIVARHAWAGPANADPRKERERPLTPEGQATALAMAKALKATGEKPRVIFCSPLQRTTETADIFGKALGIAVNVVGDLSPDRPLEEGILQLIGHGEVKRIMLICHVDNTTPGFSNFGPDKWDDLVMCEIRGIKIDRKSGQWKERFRILPSDLGLKDRT